MSNTELRRQLATLPTAVAAELLANFQGGPFKTPPCYCGNCRECQQKLRWQQRQAQLVGCRCGVADCDCARWEETFQKNHGPAERAYYSGSTIRSAGSSLSGAIGQDVRGLKLRPGVAPAPERDQWRAMLHAEADAGRERRALRTAA